MRNLTMVMPAPAALALLLVAAPALAAGDEGPSFDCAAARLSSVEQRVCKDPALAALDRTLAATYAAAVTKAGGGAAADALKATQRGWIKGRNDCWKAADVPACVDAGYRRRIAELQAQYRLVEPVGAARYLCPGPPEREASAQYFATDPPTAVVEFAGETQLMFAAPSGSGARYAGGNRQLWEHQGIGLLRWGADAREMSCPVR